MKNITKKIILILAILMLLFSINSRVYAFGTIVQDGDDFISSADKGKAKIGIEASDLQDLSGFLYNALLSTGVVVAVIVATVLGIQFVLGGAEGQAKVKEMLVPFVVGSVVVFGGFGIWKIALSIGGMVSPTTMTVPETETSTTETETPSTETDTRTEITTETSTVKPITDEEAKKTADEALKKAKDEKPGPYSEQYYIQQEIQKLKELQKMFPENSQEYKNLQKEIEEYESRLTSQSTTTQTKTTQTKTTQEKEKVEVELKSGGTAEADKDGLGEMLQSGYITHDEYYNKMMELGEEPTALGVKLQNKDITLREYYSRMKELGKELMALDQLVQYGYIPQEKYVEELREMRNSNSITEEEFYNRVKEIDRKLGTHSIESIVIMMKQKIHSYTKKILTKLGTGGNMQRNKIISILIITFIATILITSNVFAVQPSDMNGVVADVDTSFIDNITNVIRNTGSAIAIGALMVIGIKYILGSTEEKASYKKSMMPYIIGCIVLFGVSNIIARIQGFALQIGESETSIANSIVGIIRTVGTFISVGALMIIGIKYMMGSAEEKASYKKTMIPYIIGCFVLFGASYLAPRIQSMVAGLGSSEASAGNAILGMISVVGTFISVGTLMVLGIKYMTGSAEERASYKKTMIPYIVGAVLLFGAVNIASVVYNLSQNVR